MPTFGVTHRTQSALFALVIFALSSPAFPQVLPPTASPPASQLSAEEAATSWDLTQLYGSEQAWDESMARAQKRASGLQQYRGTLGASAASMLTALLAISDAQRDAYRLWTYASLKADEDLRVARNQERKQLAQRLLTKIDERTAWLSPEILKVGAQKVQAFRTQNSTLDQRFGFRLANTLRAAPHTLGTEAEDVIAAAGMVLAQPSNLHGLLSDAEFPAPAVVLADGTSVRLDQPAYEKYRQTPNRSDRKKVFDAYWGA